MAPGRRIHIFGVRLGAGTAEVKQGSTTLRARVLSGSDERIEAILPEAIVSGPADLTVSYDGQTSRPISIRVAPRSFGISEIAREGSIVTLRGTGLGPKPTVAAVEIFVGGRPVRSCAPSVRTSGDPAFGDPAP